ncbi:MAG: FHA domain-containing protein [Chloroflexota bacterium]|nr:FHA domain-containing protein [Chloroflexota bacterium]
MSDRSLAGQYSDSHGTDPGFIQRVEQAFQVLQTANISGLIEVETATRTIRVLVDPSRREAARTALKDILPSIPRRLKVRVDANNLRRVTPAIPVIMPGEEITIGRSSMGSYHEKMIIIDDDPKISNQHLKVRWDGLSRLEIKDVSDQKNALIDTVLIGPDWMELEPGAKVRIGETTVSFQLSDPVS